MTGSTAPCADENRPGHVSHMPQTLEIVGWSDERDTPACGDMADTYSAMPVVVDVVETHAMFVEQDLQARVSRERKP